MSLNKAIEHGKEKRKAYRKPQSIDKTCRNHGSCEWCERNRMYSRKKSAEACSNRMEELRNGRCEEM